jgi:hypothetical protein
VVVARYGECPPMSDQIRETKAKIEKIASDRDTPAVATTTTQEV